GGCFSKPK
nr:Chain C, Apoptosis-inducing factor 3 [Homo sapiens]5O9V_D Chain D, Apoptosis-inducing factor 3 [Homo sapiens]